jgi:SRSO17 transposase
MELESYYDLYRPYFAVEKQGYYGFHYLSGLLDPNIVRKSSENIALARLGTASVRPLQHFVGESPWHDAGLISEHRRQTGLHLGDEAGVVIIDGSDCAKQGEYSVGVQRQWCGELGKTANCQAGVYLGYSSRKGYTLLDRRLYMPECWFTPEYARHRYGARVPATLAFHTKNELVWQMIQELCQAGTLPARWLTMDEAFGRDTQLLDRIANQTPYAYFAEVPKDTLLWTEQPATFLPEYSGKGRPPTQLQLAPDAPAPQTAAQIAASLPASAWTLHALKEGSKGLIIAHMAFCRVVAVRDGLPGPELWLVLRRSPSDPTDIHFFLSNAPADIDTNQLVAVAALRWPIETIFEQAKQLLGLNHYETRTWFGWHHHMTFVILAFGFLARSQLTLAPDAPALTLPQVVDLLKAVLPKPDFDPLHAIALLRYKQARIASAKKSHYLAQRDKIIDKLIVTQ